MQFVDSENDQLIRFDPQVAVHVGRRQEDAASGKQVVVEQEGIELFLIVIAAELLHQVHHEGVVEEGDVVGDEKNDLVDGAGTM